MYDLSEFQAQSHKFIKCIPVTRGNQWIHSSCSISTLHLTKHELHKSHKIAKEIMTSSYLVTLCVLSDAPQMISVVLKKGMFVPSQAFDKHRWSIAFSALFFVELRYVSFQLCQRWSSVEFISKAREMKWSCTFTGFARLKGRERRRWGKRRKGRCRYDIMDCNPFNIRGLMSMDSDSISVEVFYIATLLNLLCFILFSPKLIFIVIEWGV